ncbi:MAG: crosslink repair DNA glycosylase YcaQ family protein [Pseudomonadota bacterium]
MLRISNAEARRIFLDRHRLAETPQGPATGADLFDLIHSLGFVQLDSINTVARAHDLILYARRPRYRPKDLKRLYERDRALFEHWTHDAAVIPMTFYPWWALRRRRDAEKLRQSWRANRRGAFEAQFQKVLDQIRSEGPCCAADVGKGEKRGSGGWWDWHPSKTALEYLWRSGALCVVGREGFQKRYDLTERVLERSLCDAAQMPDAEATIDWCCRQALDRLGFATHGELAAFWAHITPAEAQAWCATQLAEGNLIAVEIESADGSVKQALARPEIEADPARQQQVTARLRILSPFDPALRDRNRAARLFGFDYRIEVFVPGPKRKFGYYVFPILEGAQIVGRVDMKAFRDQNILRVRALWPEGRTRWGRGRIAAFEADVMRITRLAGVDAVEYAPDWLRASAQEHLRQIS